MNFETFLSAIFTPAFYYKILGSSVIILMFALLYFLNNIVFRSIISKFSTHFSTPLKIVRTVFGIIIVIVGFVSTLGNWGIDVKTLIAGFGITGFIVTFALKDILTSVLSGVMIVVSKPFKVGDRILVDKLEGVVQNIDMQHTTILHKNREYMIPNTMVFEEAIKIRELEDNGSSNGNNGSSSSSK